MSWPNRSKRTHKHLRLHPAPHLRRRPNRKRRPSRTLTVHRRVNPANPPKPKVLLPQVSGMLVYVLMALVLLYKPEGLFKN